jgi:hypothetical protein
VAAGGCDFERALGTLLPVRIDRSLRGRLQPSIFANHPEVEQVLPQLSHTMAIRHGSVFVTCM